MRETHQYSRSAAVAAKGERERKTKQKNLKRIVYKGKTIQRKE
jgi:hypothetical protein